MVATDRRKKALKQLSFFSLNNRMARFKVIKGSKEFLEVGPSQLAKLIPIRYSVVRILSSCLEIFNVL